MKMQLFDVDSSMIKQAGYDEDSKTLQLVFNNGAVYNYANVKKSQFKRLMISVSAGKYFGKYIKKFPDKYPCSKLEK